jgi:hypothetical protein
MQHLANSLRHCSKLVFTKMPREGTANGPISVGLGGGVLDAYPESFPRIFDWFFEVHDQHNPWFEALVNMEADAASRDVSPPTQHPNILNATVGFLAEGNPMGWMAGKRAAFGFWRRIPSLGVIGLFNHGRVKAQFIRRQVHGADGCGQARHNRTPVATTRGLLR